MHIAQFCKERASVPAALHASTLMERRPVPLKHLKHLKSLKTVHVSTVGAGYDRSLQMRPSETPSWAQPSTLPARGRQNETSNMKIKEKRGMPKVPKLHRILHHCDAWHQHGTTGTVIRLQGCTSREADASQCKPMQTSSPLETWG